MKKIEANEKITQLLYKLAVGVLSETEREELDRWVAERPERQEYVNQLSSPDFLEKEYHLFKAVDHQRALQQMQQRIAPTSHRTLAPTYPRTLASIRFLRLAAAIALLLVAGGLVWYAQYTKVTPPDISEAVQLAMQRSVESGKAELSLGNEDRGGENGSKPSASSDNGNLAPTHPHTLSPTVIPENVPEDFDLMAARRVTTYHNKEFWLTLDDGTLVHLNYNTRVIYPEKFGRKKREVILDGEAYFMVAKDRSRPFVVHTPEGDVKVYGTEFMVSTRTDKLNDTNNSSARPEGALARARTTITLIKGSIGVTPKSGSEIMMTPGQQCSLLNAQYSITEVDIEPYVAWNQGVYVFEDCTLERLMNVLSHWYGYEVVFKDEKARQKKFTGELDKYSSFRPVLDAISSVTDIRFTINGNTIDIQ